MNKFLNENKFQNRNLKFIWNNKLLDEQSATKKKIPIDQNKFLCFSNQFYCLIKLPELNEIFFSINTYNILGNTISNLSLSNFVELIHPKHQKNVIETYTKIFNRIMQSNQSINTLECLSTINFSIKNTFNQYINILQQTCIYNSGYNNNDSYILFLFSDITPFHANYSKIKTSKKATNLFTKRELEILHLLSKGKSSRQIASNLNITKNTVDTHRRNMLNKSELANTAELISYTYS